MATYGEVKTDFLALLNRRDITSAQTTTFLQNAIRRVQRKMRVAGMEKSVTITIDALDSDGVLLPDDYLEIIGFQNSEGTPLERRDLATVKLYAESTGIPLYYTRQVNKFVFGPAPAVDDTIRMDYFGEFTEVSDDADTNALTIFAPDVVLYAALVYAAMHFNDKRLAAFNEAYNALLAEVEEQDDRDALTGLAVVPPAYAFPDDGMN